MKNKLAHKRMNNEEQLFYWRAPIVRLRFFSCPSHVAFFVMSIVVNAVYGMVIGWAITHLVYEFLERLKAKFYATTAIEWVPLAFWVVATSFCAMKYKIFRHAVQSFRRTTSVSKRLAALNRLNLRYSNQVPFAGQSFFTTKNATAEPIVIAVSLLSSKTQNHKMPNLLMSQILKSVVGRFGAFGDVRMIFIHKFLHIRNLCLGLREPFARFREPFLLYHVKC